MKDTNFEDVRIEIDGDFISRTSAKENSLRRRLAESFERERVDQGMSMRKLAEEMLSSASQVQRLLHKEQGGSLTLRTLCRDAEVLGLELTIKLTRE